MLIANLKEVEHHDIHSGKSIEEVILPELNKLVADFEALTLEQQETVLKDMNYSATTSSSATRNALRTAIAKVLADEEAAIDEALGKVNAITGTAADVKVIKENADILGLDLTAFEALDDETGQAGGRQTAVMKDLVSNKPDEGYDQGTLKAIFDSIVAVRTATQASMDLVNEAESLENIDYVEDLLAAFEGVAEGHTIHSGKAISDKVTELEKLVSDFKALPEANQAAALTAVIENKPEGGYLRSQSTLDALANAIAEEQGKIEGAKAAFLAGLKTAVSSDVATVEIDGESISVTFAHNATVDGIKDAADALVGELLKGGVTGTLTIDGTDFNLDEEDVASKVAHAILEVTAEDFLNEGSAEVSYKATVTVDGVEFTLEGGLSFQMGDAQ
jgi:hypothetical protein